MSLDSILTGMELNGIFLLAKMECSFHSCRNGGVIPFFFYKDFLFCPYSMYALTFNKLIILVETL